MRIVKKKFFFEIHQNALDSADITIDLVKLKVQSKFANNIIVSRFTEILLTTTFSPSLLLFLLFFSFIL